MGKLVSTKPEGFETVEISRNTATAPTTAMAGSKGATAQVLSVRQQEPLLWLATGRTDLLCGVRTQAGSQ